tara:strand:+ start:441 stop:743 length:303 start_codon:yes stop_codon:yes gene_type:complete
MARKIAVIYFFFSLLTAPSFSKEVSKTSDLKKAELAGDMDRLRFLRKREWLEDVIKKAKNLKQEIAKGSQGTGRSTASVLDEMTQKEWEKEIDLLLKDEK